MKVDFILRYRPRVVVFYVSTMNIQSKLGNLRDVIDEDRST